jgi:hypothetical protein
MQPSIYHRGLMVGETPNIDRIGNEGAIGLCRHAELHLQAPTHSSPAWDHAGTQREFGKNHLGDHTAVLPTAHGFQEYWGYLYHLDAMQQVSFPEINQSPNVQAVAALEAVLESRASDVPVEVKNDAMRADPSNQAARRLGGARQSLEKVRG